MRILLLRENAYSPKGAMPKGRGAIAAIARALVHFLVVRKKADGMDEDHKADA
jgi:hypothetical protein